MSRTLISKLAANRESSEQLKTINGVLEEITGGEFEPTSMMMLKDVGINSYSHKLGIAFDYRDKTHYKKRHLVHQHRSPNNPAISFYETLLVDTFIDFHCAIYHIPLIVLSHRTSSKRIRRNLERKYRREARKLNWTNEEWSKYIALKYKRHTDVLNRYIKMTLI